VTDWAIGDAIAAVRSPEAHRFMADSFGYDSGFRPFNAGDAIQYLLGGGDPTAEARVPTGGMDTIPQAFARRFEARGGSVLLGHELERLEPDDGQLILRSAGDTLRARRVVLTMPIPALCTLADASPALGTPTWRHLLASVEGFPATKLYAWYERPWWRRLAGGIEGIRTTTDLPVKKVFYFDERLEAPASIIGAYTDGRHTTPWVELAGGVSNGGPAPRAMVEAMTTALASLHPEAATIPDPLGTAFMHWGSDPLEIGWTFWRAGFVSDDMAATAIQPEPELPVHVAGETFARAQGWIEGALETAEIVTDRILGAE
jgi:monoamine oxidase